MFPLTFVCIIKKCWICILFLVLCMSQLRPLWRDSPTRSLTSHTSQISENYCQGFCGNPKISIPNVTDWSIEMTQDPKCHGSIPHVTDWSLEITQMSRIDPNVTDWSLEMIQMSRIDPKCHRLITWDGPSHGSILHVTDWSLEMIQMSRIDPQMSQIDHLRWPKCHRSTSWDGQMSHIKPNLHFKYRN